MLCPVNYAHFWSPWTSRLIRRDSLRPMIFAIRGMRRRPPPPGKPPIVPPAKRCYAILLYSKLNTNHFQVYDMNFLVLFGTREKEWMKVEDVKELLWRRHVYNNAVVSLRKVFKEEIEAKEKEGLGIEGLKKEEEEEFERLLQLNEQRNQIAARRRKEHEKTVMLELEKTILGSIEEKLNRQEQLVKERTAEVLEMIERSKSFVTKENLDDKLQEALENPVVYDFAVDLQANRLYNPEPVKYLEGKPPLQTGRIYDVTLNTKH